MLLVISHVASVFASLQASVSLYVQNGTEKKEKIIAFLLAWWLYYFPWVI